MPIVSTEKSESLLKEVSRSISSTSSGRFADIILSVDNFRDYIVFPVVPQTLPRLETPQNNDVFRGINADMSIIGTLGLRKVEWEGLLPSDVTKYTFTRPNGSNAEEVIQFIKRYQDEYIPFRLGIVFDNGDVYLNMACVCNNFRYWKESTNDYQYSIEFIEYRMLINGVIRS